MKSRPILFSAPMVRAILAGRKTQTRRIVKIQPVRILTFKEIWDGKAMFSHPDDPPECFRHLQCAPYGVRGDRLWVKETWRTTRGLDHCKPTGLVEGAPIEYVADQWMPGFGLHEKGKTRVSLFMRRWMSRITLEIESVRVERLNAISDEDAQAEGVTVQVDAVMAAAMAGPPETPARMEYWHLWESINGPGSWDANPWVWVIGFRRVTP